MVSSLGDHFAGDWNLNSERVNNYYHSRIPSCNNCGSETGSAQCLELGLCLCQTCYHQCLEQGLCLFQICVSNANSISRIPSCNNCGSETAGNVQCLEQGLNYSDQQVTMLQLHYLDILKNTSYSRFNGNEIKEVIDNVLDGELDQLIDEIMEYKLKTKPTKILASSSPGVSSVLHKDYNIEALANASSQDCYTNQMIGSLAKEETNKFGIFPNIVQLDYGQSQFLATDEMLRLEVWKKYLLCEEAKQRYCEEAKRYREEAKQRYFAKREKRKFGKQIRYESRKSTADSKRRMKGRFTKAGAEYDYDPRANKIMSRL